MRAWVGFVLLLAACQDGNGVRRAAEAALPPEDEVFASFPPGATADDLQRTVDKGLQTKGKGPDLVRFVVLRDGDRHGVAYREDAFHVIVGGGVAMPAGALRIRKEWHASGMVDGTNEQPQTWGVSVVVEPGSPRPYAAPVREAVRAFCTALTRRVPVHPDCILAMQEIPFTNAHPADGDERTLAAYARAEVKPPPVDGKLTIVTAARRIPVTYEHRTTTAAIQVGMMLRRAFDGKDRGMLFEYKFADYKHFWMKNCLIAIDLAYIRKGRIEQLVTMEAMGDRKPSELRYYDSNAAVRHVLEMPEGWFAKNGVAVGDRVDFE